MFPVILDDHSFEDDQGSHYETFWVFFAPLKIWASETHQVWYRLVCFTFLVLAVINYSSPVSSAYKL
jgi:hypothetical protein